MNFWWEGVLVETLTKLCTSDRTDVGWEYFEFEVTAPTDFATLSFSSLKSSGPNGPAIDDVVVGDTPRFGGAPECEEQLEALTMENTQIKQQNAELLRQVTN